MARSRALLTGSEAGSEAGSKNENAAMIQFEQIVIAAPFMQSSKGEHHGTIRTRSLEYRRSGLDAVSRTATLSTVGNSALRRVSNE
ncbi:hypothetical protein ACTJLC_21670 [Paraburkholderia sp. 22099]|uniref:hypothetical protein n=1 Tax=Paraburkholderia sp. 22099 TaxID=3453875 RepID=UPI003F853DB5